MKVFTRVLVKVLIILLIAAAAAGTAAAYQGQRQSTAAYTMDRYLTLLLENNGSRAFSLVDKSDDVILSGDEFEEAVAGKQYSLYSSFDAEEIEKRRDSNGNEYTDFRVKFYDAAEEMKAEETFSLKKQSGRRLGLFDVWKVLGDHCLVQNFKITVPAGSTVYLDAKKADAAWMTREENSPAEVYVIPRLLPGDVSLTIRHPVLESVNTTFDSTEGALDYSTSMELKESARGECKEIGVAALKNLLSSSAKGQVSALNDSLKDLKGAKNFVRKEGSALHSDGSAFVSMAASAFVAEFNDPEYSDEDGNIRLEMKFSYHYRIKKDVTSQSDVQTAEDGTPVEVVETVADSGNSTGTFTMSYTGGAWKILDMNLPVAG